MGPPPRKKAPRGSSRAALKHKRLDAFLTDFDREVQTRKDQILMDSEGLLKEIDNMYNMEFLRLPAALQEMNWLSYYALGGSEKALEKAAMVDLDILEITKQATEAIQTPMKMVQKAKKAKLAIETIEEEAGPPILPTDKRSRHGSDASGAPESSSQRLQKAKTSIKKAPGSRRGRPPPARSSRLSRRSSKVKFLTPSGSCPTRSAALKGAPCLLTPKFDISPGVFKTPGLRAPAAQERIFSISVNGSPLAATSDVFLTIPAGGGESICLRASELSRHDLLSLNPDTLGSVKKLSAQLASLCGTIRSTK
ncbi:LOW QUALITY PROTEIN: borealin-like [Paroedura picta]|uniref:LOW QUALITY PROTEIN: borealin-like n=1 Tax=Paroedura picta TaxID=143630 RepID=UPI0040576DDD